MNTYNMFDTVIGTKMIKVKKKKKLKLLTLVNNKFRK